MEFSAEQIADFLGGKIEGDKDVKVNSVSKIEEGKPNTLSFLSNIKYSSYLYETQSSIVLINDDFHLEKEVKTTLIRVKDAYKSFASLLDLYEGAKEKKVGVEELSFIDPMADIGEEVYIGAFSYVGKGAKIGKGVRIYPHTYVGDNVQVGKDTILYSGVSIYENCKVGENCILHSGAVVGADGFGFAPDEETGVYKKIPQIGNVVIEDNVELGANTTVDRATMGSTIIKKGAKLDNLIQVAHNVEIGENTVFAAQVGIAGSTKIGSNCMFGGQVGIAGHVNIANRTKIGAQSGIASRVKEEGQTMLGSPAISINDYRRLYLLYRKLPVLNNKILELEKKVEELKKNS